MLIPYTTIVDLMVVGFSAKYLADLSHLFMFFDGLPPLEDLKKNLPEL
jgi:hypothetical protein